MILFRQYQINGPASANVGPQATEVIQDGLLGATGLLQRVGQDGKLGDVEVPAGETFVVRCLGERKCGRRQPARSPFTHISAQSAG